MVGVPGKYKGCETCRRRRVKCSNERPYCYKCISTGRECEGYEREMVFITGTPANKGRVASHPKKGLPAEPTSSTSWKQSRSKSRARERTSATRDTLPDLAPSQPLSSAWDDHIALAGNDYECNALMTALPANMGSVTRNQSDALDRPSFSLDLPSYSPSKIPSRIGPDELFAGSRCLVHVPGLDDAESHSESYCVFLFEQILSTSSSIEVTFLPSDPVRSLGPDHFKTFPRHHFFVRVYRPLKITLSLLKRQPVFISRSEWITGPWEWHPKSHLDRLLDIMSQLPAIFEQTDQLLLYQATLGRRQEAQNLLHECLVLEAQFEHWLGTLANHRDQQKPMSYWAEDMPPTSGGIPFSYAYCFSDSMTGTMFLYFWMAHILFYKNTESLNRMIFEPVIDAYPNTWPDLPPTLQVGQSKYQQTREFADSICRGLDSALEGTTQPDILVAPLTIALDLYREINATSSQDGLLEIIWLEAFRGRLIEKGQYVTSVVQGNQWVEVAMF